MNAESVSKFAICLLLFHFAKSSVQVRVVFMSVHPIKNEANYVRSRILLETNPVDRSIFLV